MSATKATCNTILDLGRPSKRARTEKEEADPLLLHRDDIWVGKILPFLGPGHYLFVAGINKRLKHMYHQYFATIKKAPKMKRINRSTGARWKEGGMEAMDTCYSAAFLSVSCVTHFLGSPKEHSIGSHFVSTMAAKYGNLQVVK